MEKYGKTNFGMSPASAGLVGGIAGGVTQAYATMGRLANTCNVYNENESR